MAKWKLNKANNIAVDLGNDDIYGATGFKCVVSKPDGTQETLTDFSEAVVSIASPESCKASGDQTNTKVVAVDDASGFEVGMVAKVKDKEIYFYIEAVDTTNNTLTARNTITATIADADEIDQVGNTGFYQKDYTPDSEGLYYFIVSNPTIGLQNEVAKVEVIISDDENVLEAISKLDADVRNANKLRVKVIA